MLAALAGEDVLAADETPVSVLDRTPPAPAPDDGGEKDPEEKDGKAGSRGAARADHPDPGRAADVPAGHGLAAEGRPRGRAPGRVHRLPDHRRLHRIPAPSDLQAGRHPAVRRPRHPQVPGGHETRPRRRPELGRRHHRGPPRARTRRSRPPAPAGTPNSASRHSTTCGNATTRPSKSGRPTTGCGTGTTGNHPGYALACWLRDYKEQVFLFTRELRRELDEQRQPSAARKPRSATRPSPATGTPWPPSPAGAACAATSTPPPPTASPHSTPSAAPSPANPGYRHSPQSPDISSRPPVNGHDIRDN